MAGNSKHSFCVIILILFVSCRYSKLPKNLDLPIGMCYTEKEMNNNSTIRMDGFYINRIKLLNESANNKSSEVVNGSNEINKEFDSAYIYTTEIYYKNGLWVNIHSGYEMFKNGISTFNVIDTLKKFLQSVSYPKKHKYFYTDNSWGTYLFKGDTLIKYKINHPSLLDGFWTPGLHKDFVQKNSITPYSYSNLKVKKNDERKTTYWVYNLTESAEKTLVFEPFEFLPDSKYAWILKEKVFWCDENEYKNWKKQR